MNGFDPGPARRMEAATWLVIGFALLMLVAQMVRAGWL